MRVKPLFLAMVTCCSLQLASAGAADTDIARKAILDLKSAQQLLQAAQQTTDTKGWPCAVVIVDGQVIGAIGVSADTPAHDDEIALAALAALPQRRQP